MAKEKDVRQHHQMAEGKMPTAEGPPTRDKYAKGGHVHGGKAVHGHGSHGHKAGVPGHGHHGHKKMPGKG